VTPFPLQAVRFVGVAVKGVGAWPSEFSSLVTARKLGNSCFGFVPLHIRVVGRLGTGVSAAPDLLTVPEQASRYVVRLKCWFGCLYLKFSFGYLATYSTSAPQVVFMGVSGSPDIYFYGGAVICVMSCSMSPILVLFGYAVPACIVKKAVT
jgi:hypothetical protein